MAGSDAGVESEVEMEGEDAGETSSDDGWQVKHKSRTKRKKSDSVGSWNSDVDSVINVRKPETFKVKLQFDSPGSVNPLKLTKALNNTIGEVSVKPLRDGNLLIICNDIEQQESAIKLTSLDGKKVKCFSWEGKRTVQGVITGVTTDIPIEDILSNVTGAKVVKAKRLMYTKDGVKQESLSVMLQFNEEVLPVRVKVGYLSYQVRPYIPPPLRCFKCQRFGHVAAVCRGKQRCGKCGEEGHEYGKCNEGTKIKCCNCGGEHSAAYKGCGAHKRAAEIQRVRVEEKLTYAEAIKKVNRATKKDNVMEQQPPMGRVMEQKLSHANGHAADKINVGVDKVKFVAFLAEVINCSAQTQSRTDRIRIIIRAAKKYLDVGEITVEMINETLTAGLQDTQSSCTGL